MTTYIIALGILVATVALEDVQEANATHGFLRDWWYGENRWRVKYKNGVSGERYWWSRLGFGAFIDLWHLAKSIRVTIFCLLLLSWAGLSLWWFPVAWMLYGGLHDGLFYGRLFK